ncbi:MAG: hypothetical protein KA170_02950 [Candidatus Promineofilum sp.]|nr:hypothetical protein [Promineifilum sp.]
MRKILMTAVGGLLLGAVMVIAVLATHLAAAKANGSDSNANLPVVLRPENTPTPSVTPTLAPTLTPTITPTPTAYLGCPPLPTPTASAVGLRNGGFEGCWDTIEQGNQEPDAWELTWVKPGDPLYDARYAEPASAIAEMIHKLKRQLPPDEWPGAPHALILDGDATFKIFSNYNVFGSQLRQRVSLPAGSYRLTVPVQLHWHENLDGKDQYTAESGAWVITAAAQSGGWVHAKQMGDRQWFYHVVEFNVPAAGEVDVVIRVKSAYRSIKDFFIDGVRLEPISAVSPGRFSEHAPGQLTSRPRLLEALPPGEIVRP